MTVKIFIGFCLASALLSAHAQEVAPVEVDTVIREHMSQTVPVLGRVVALQHGTVAARTEGPVAEVRVEVGDEVTTDDVLAVLDQSRLEARLELARAQLREDQARLATAQASARLARKELARLEKIRNSPAFTESLHDTQVEALEVAQSRIQEAQAVIARAEANLHLARIELRDATITAPFAGTVALRYATPGAWLNTGDPVVTLINRRAMELEADVPAARLDGLEAGDQVHFHLPKRDNGKQEVPVYTARVRAVVPDENARARTRPIRLTPLFEGTPPALAANQSVVVEIPAGPPREVLSVHKDAVLRKAEGGSVFVVVDNAVQLRPVQLGEAVGNRLHVVAGLHAGELVVVRGNERLHPGQAIHYEISRKTSVENRTKGKSDK